MFYALSWLLVLALVALWSLAAWGLHGIAVWAISHAGGLTGAASGAGALRLPDWLAPWVPTEVVQAVMALVSGLAPAVDSLLQAAPALAGGLGVVAWVVWAIGAVLLVLLGAALHLLIAMWRRRGGGGSGPQTRPQAAA